MSKHRQQNKAHQTDHGETSISYEEVQRRAYQIHEEKGGSDLENWLEAERVLKEEHLDHPAQSVVAR